MTNDLDLSTALALIADCWGQRCGLVKGCLPDLASRSLTIESILEPFDRSDSLLERVELLRGGNRISWASINKSLVASGPAIDLALDLGLTILAKQFQKDHSGCFSICRRLQIGLGHATFATLFMSRTTDPNFSAHYDSVDIAVLQISGKKVWKIYGRSPELPLTDADVYTVEVGREEPIATFELEEGDFLYVPRGFIHSVQAVEAPNSHITFGIHTTTLADILRICIETAQGDARLRSAGPTASSPNSLNCSELAVIASEVMTADRIQQALSIYFKRAGS